MSTVIVAPKSIDLPDRYLTLEEYIHLEQNAAYKSEYLNGKVYAMPGASPAHGRIASNINGNLWLVFEDKPCQVYGSDLQVKVEATGLYTYPDITVVCEEEEYTTDKKPASLLNPRVIIEILSDSTERYDRGRKFDHYRQIPSLQEYVLVSQTKQQVELYSRQGESGTVWQLHVFTENDAVVPLRSIDVVLAMKKIYAKVVFSEDSISLSENNTLSA